MPLVKLKAILPKGVLQPREVARAVRNKLVDEGRIVQRALRGTVGTWRNAPTFEMTQHVAPTQGQAIYVTVSPAGDPEAVRHFKFVNDGTAVRWAVMSKDFRPKTTPGKLKAGPGKPPADPVLRGRSQMFSPRPGIVARKFTFIIKADRQPKFSTAVRAALARAMAKRGPTP